MNTAIERWLYTIDRYCHPCFAENVDVHLGRNTFNHKWTIYTVNANEQSQEKIAENRMAKAIKDNDAIMHAIPLTDLWIPFHYDGFLLQNDAKILGVRKYAFPPRTDTIRRRNQDYPIYQKKYINQRTTIQNALTVIAHNMPVHSERKIWPAASAHARMALDPKMIEMFSESDLSFSLFRTQTHWVLVDNVQYPAIWGNT